MPAHLAAENLSMRQLTSAYVSIPDDTACACRGAEAGTPLSRQSSIRIDTSAYVSIPDDTACACRGGEAGTPLSRPGGATRARDARACARTGARFTCFTSTKVQMLTRSACAAAALAHSMLTYAHVCSRMLRMLTYAHVC